MYRIILGIVIVLSIVAVYLTVNRKISADVKTYQSNSSITEKITIENNRFIPTLITIKSGDSVIITNNDIVAHQIMSDPSVNKVDYLPLNISAINPGESKTVLFSTQGSFGFYDLLKPDIKGQVVVE